MATRKGFSARTAARREGRTRGLVPLRTPPIAALRFQGVPQEVPPELSPAIMIDPKNI